MADQLLFEQSNESQMTTEPFVSRQVVYVIDQNNGNYNGQIQLDTSSLSNSGKYASYSEAYLEIPLVYNIQANGVAGFAAAAPTNFLVGLKNGFHQLIHSLSVEYNNTSVVQLTPFTNFYVSYKLMTSFSEGDVKKFGQSIGFWPDSATSWDFNPATAAANTSPASGPGSSNNACFGWETIYPTNNGYIYSDTASGAGAFPLNASAAIVAGSPVPGVYTTQLFNHNNTIQTVANYGFYKRLQWCGFDPAQAPYSTFINLGNTRSILKNYFAAGGADNNAYKTWFVMARIRLKDLCDFFDKLPLVKGAYLRFIINTNTSSQVVTVTNVGAAAGQPLSQSLTIATAPTINGGTNPLMITSAQIGQGFQMTPRVVGAGTYGVSCGIVSITTPYTGVVVAHPQSACRLYVPLYQLNPVQEEQYISLNRTKKVIYRDIYQYQVNVGTEGNFNSLLTNGIPNPKTVIIIPILQPSANNVNLTGAVVSVAPHNSPFASEPGTTSPLIAFNNFNIQVAGVNQFIQNENYDFEQFVNELAPQNAINGGLVDGLTSGLIGELEFSNNYRYYVCDVSRRLPAEDSVPKSIQILGDSKCLQPITLFVFIEFEKSITIDLITGAKID